MTETKTQTESSGSQGIQFSAHAINTMKKTGLAHRIVHSRTSRVLLFSSLAVFIVLSSWFYRKLNQSQKQRYLSYVTADELRQSSDDLTRMVRTYVMTKNPRYEQMYWDILAIRNGQKARPLRYENIYWDFMASTNTKPRPDGQKISLFEMMKDLGFTPEELAKLTQAETHSNDLVRIEEIAMHAMKGEFLDAEGKFTVKKEPDYDYARTILYGESYHKEKVDIMTPIDEFFVMVNARTEAKVNRDTICTYVCISLVFTTILLLLGMSKVELSTRKRSEERLEAINACLSNLGSDFAVNADRITTLLGETLGATCSLYNRLDHGMLSSLGQWQTPPDYNPQDRPDGHICYDVIQRNDDEVCTIRELQNSPYAQSDPNVLAHNLETYVGQVVTCNSEPVGALCAVFQKDFNPSEDERRIIGILTSAIRGEEERSKAEQAMVESDKLFMKTFHHSVDAALLIEGDTFVDCNAQTVQMLRAASKDEILSTHPSQLSPETQPDGRSSFEKANEMIACALEKGSNRFEWDHCRLDGEVFPVEVTLMPVSLFGKQQLYCMWKDITEQKQAHEKYEENIAETERMNRLMVGREKRVIEMKREVNSLLDELGRDPQYQSVLEEAETVISSDKTG